MMQRPALAVAEHLGEGEDPRLARGEQLLAGELRRGVQMALRPFAARPDQIGRKGMQMGLVAGRHLQRGRLDLQKAAPAKPLPQRRHDAPARQQEWPAVDVAVAVPPGGGGNHEVLIGKAGVLGQDGYVAARNHGARGPDGQNKE